MAKVRSETASAARGGSRARGGGRRAGSAIKTTEGGWVGSTEQLYMVLQEAGDAITVVDVTGQLRYANKAAATAMGFEDPADAVSLPSEELLAHFELLDADGKPLLEEALPGRRAQAAPQTPQTPPAPPAEPTP